MIACQACGNDNPIGTRYCRRCGAKLAFSQERVVAAVQRDQADLAAARWSERGRSALIIGLFLLTCALVLRYAIVPQLPEADVPPVEFGGILPSELPRVEAQAEARP
jgi:hypothetical protein